MFSGSGSKCCKSLFSPPQWKGSRLREWKEVDTHVHACVHARTQTQTHTALNSKMTYFLSNMTNIFWFPSSASVSGLWGGTLDIERLLAIMDVQDTGWMKAACGSEWERTKACHHLCSVEPVSHVRAHERRVLSLLTDEWTDRSVTSGGVKPLVMQPRHH